MSNKQTTDSHLSFYNPNNHLLQSNQLIEGFFEAVHQIDTRMVHNYLSIYPWLAYMKDQNGNTAIHSSLNNSDDAEEYLKIYEYLLSKEPNIVNIKNNAGKTPLDLAVEAEAYLVVALFKEEELKLQNHNDLSLINNLNNTTIEFNRLINVILSGDGDDLTKFLNNMHNVQYHINIADDSGYTALHYAVCSENFYAVEILIKNNIDINKKVTTGSNALHMACKYLSSATNYIAKLLIQNGITIFSDIEDTALSRLALSSNIYKTDQDDLDLAIMILKNGPKLEEYIDYDYFLSENSFIKTAYEAYQNTVAMDKISQLFDE